MILALRILYFEDLSVGMTDYDIFAGSGRKLQKPATH
jgi:hypothetical protein